MKRSVLVLGSPGITAVIASVLAGTFNIETVPHSAGAFDARQAAAKLAGDPGIRKLVVVPDGDIGQSVRDIIHRAARLGKPTTIIPPIGSDPDRLRQQSSAVGARFFDGSLDRQALLEMVSAQAG